MDQMGYGSDEEEEEEEYPTAHRLGAAKYRFEGMGKDPCPAAARYVQRFMAMIGLADFVWNGSGR